MARRPKYGCHVTVTSHKVVGPSCAFTCDGVLEQVRVLTDNLDAFLKCYN